MEFADYIFPLTKQEHAFARWISKGSLLDSPNEDWYAKLISPIELPALQSITINDFSIDSPIYSGAIDEAHNEVLPLNKTDKYATNPESVNALNDNFRKVLDSKKADFCRRLARVDFEDGYDNEVILEVDGYMTENKFATMLWIYNLYAENQKNYVIIAGLLRIVSSVVAKDDINYFIALIKCGLQDSHTACQEAALMAIEVLRTKECVDAIETTTFRSSLIQRYAEEVKESIKKELRDVA